MNSNLFNGYDDEFLASVNNAYREAEVRKTNNWDLPDGRYQGFVSYATVQPCRFDEQTYEFVVNLTVLDGEYRGTMIRKSIQIVPERMEVLKNDLSVYGVVLDDIRALGDEDTLYTVLDTIVDFAIKHKPGKNDKVYTNVYVNRYVGKISEPMQANDDDNPFAPMK